LTINAQRPQAESVQHPFFLLQIVGAFAQIQTLVHQLFQASILKWRTKTKLFR
jgi:hypothetical protein